MRLRRREKKEKREKEGKERKGKERKGKGGNKQGGSSLVKKMYISLPLIPRVARFSGEQK